MKIGVPENLIKLYGGFRGREFPQIVNKIVEQQISSETEPKVIFPENADYGNFVKLVSKEISTSVQTNVNGSCSLILTNFTPSSNGKFVFDYFEDLGIKDIATFMITKLNSNGTETKIYTNTFKNSYTPVQISGYGLTGYKYDDKPRNWNTFESIELYAGSRAPTAEVSAQELVDLFGLHAVKNLTVFSTKIQITTMES